MEKLNLHQKSLRIRGDRKLDRLRQFDISVTAANSYLLLLHKLGSHAFTHTHARSRFFLNYWPIFGCKSDFFVAFRAYFPSGLQKLRLFYSRRVPVNAFLTLVKVVCSSHLSSRETTVRSIIDDRYVITRRWQRFALLSSTDRVTVEGDVKSLPIGLLFAFLIWLYWDPLNFVVDSSFFLLLNIVFVLSTTFYFFSKPKMIRCFLLRIFFFFANLQ